MNLRRLFTSRYTLLLESQLAELQQRHREEIERINNLHRDEVSRAIIEANRGWAEADRLRQFLVPGLAPSNREAPEIPTKEKKEEAPRHGGTLFQQMAAESYEQQKAIALEAERLAKLAQQFPTKKDQAVPPAVPKEN